jgi:hypothetical protein
MIARVWRGADTDKTQSNRQMFRVEPAELPGK